MAKPPVVRVTWRDATDLHGWIGELSERLTIADALVESAGFLVEETDAHIVIALNHVTGEDTVPWGQVTVIPLEAIVEKTVLRMPRG